jgi:hypothetical protein
MIRLPFGMEIFRAISWRSIWPNYKGSISWVAYIQAWPVYPPAREILYLRGGNALELATLLQSLNFWPLWVNGIMEEELIFVSLEDHVSLPRPQLFLT